MDEEEGRARHGPRARHEAGSLSSIPGRSWFDAYSLRAQWAPVLFAVAPLAIAAPALLGTKGLVGTGAMLACLPPVLARTARDLGKRLEPALWASWGGPPTTRLLRHRDRTVSEITKARYFSVLARTAAVIRPTQEQEDADPVAADSVYASAGDWLRPITRAAAGSSLVASQNAAYGFARNLLGIRGIGLGLAIATAACMAAVAYHRYEGQAVDLDGALVAALAAAGCAATWAFGVTRESVRSAADAYARALLECCDVLPSSPAKAASRKQPGASPLSGPTVRRKSTTIEAGEPE